MDMSHRISRVNFSWIPLDLKKTQKLHPREKYPLYNRKTGGKQATSEQAYCQTCYMYVTN